MTANQSLILFVAIFWLSLWLAIKVSHLVNGRPLSDGPSLIPAVPIFPLVAVALGAAVNWLASPTGTIAVVFIHVGWIVYATFAILRGPGRTT